MLTACQACQGLCHCDSTSFLLVRCSYFLTNNVEHVWRVSQLRLWWNFQLECDHEYDISHNKTLTGR